MYEEIVVPFNKDFKYTVWTRLNLENLISTNFAQSLIINGIRFVQIDYWTWHFHDKPHSLNFRDRDQQS